MPSNRKLTESEQHWTTLLRTVRDRRADEQAGWDVLGRTYRGSFYAPNRVQSEARPEESQDAGITHEANYLFGMADTQVSSITPKRPAVTIKSRSRALQKQMKMREFVANDQLRRSQAGKFLRRAVNMSHVYPRAFIKAQWDSKRERVRYRTLPPHRIFFDVTADAWEDVRWVIEAKPITRKVFEGRIKRPGRKGGFYRSDALEDVTFGNFPTWLVAEDQKDPNTEAQSVRSNYQWTVVYEVYDFVENKLWHFLGEESAALYDGPLPWDNLRNPYYMMTFHDNLTDLGGMSDGQLAFPSVQRLNELASLKLWHAKTSIPIGLLNTAALDDPESFEEAMSDIDGPGQWVQFETRQRVPMSEVFDHTPVPQLSPDFNGIQEQIRYDTEFVLGMSPHQRGQTGSTDVATELSMIDSAQKTRSSDKQELVYDAVTWMAGASLALLAQKITEDFYMDATIDSKEATIDAMGLGFLDEEGERIPFDAETMLPEAHPYNAESSNDVAQFRKLQVTMPFLIDNPNVDQRGLTAEILRLQNMNELLTTEDQAQEAQAAQMAEAQGGDMPPSMGPGLPSPDMQGGGMPVEAEGNMVGGQVTAGTGAQGDPGAAGLGINV